MAESNIILLTGQRQVGKTTVCERLVTALRRSDIAISGLITKRTGDRQLQLHELHTGAHYPLTTPSADPAGIVVGRFLMSPEAFARGDDALNTCFPTQVFILDEVGPLELLHAQGWSRAISLLAKSRYNVAIVVVRPELLSRAIRQLPAMLYTVVNVTVETRDSLPAALQKTIISVCAPDLEITTANHGGV